MNNTQMTVFTVGFLIYAAVMFKIVWVLHKRYKRIDEALKELLTTLYSYGEKRVPKVQRRRVRRVR